MYSIGFRMLCVGFEAGDQETLNKMKDMFCDEYIKLSKEWKEDPSLNPEKLKRMSVNSFFEFFQKRFGESGTKLIRNYCRLYALKEIEKD